MVEEVAVEVTDATIEETATMPAIGPEGIECPRHIAIVGLGLIGGSLALRLRSAGVWVSAWNHRPHPYAAARAAGIDCKDRLEELVAEHPDVVVLCNPLVAMPKILETIKPIIDPTRTTLTDVGSVKGLVREQVHAAGITDCYVGAHPMTGNERSGWAAADPSIFDNALWALTYDHHTDYARIVQVAGMITRGLRNTMIVVDDETHDRAASLISHMPHVVSTALICMLVKPEILRLDVTVEDLLPDGSLSPEPCKHGFLGNVECGLRLRHVVYDVVKCFDSLFHLVVLGGDECHVTV